MPLRLICPPALVSVRDLDGVLRPALLLALRNDRSYVQVSRGPGDSVLRWLSSTRLAPATGEALRPSAVALPGTAMSGRPPRAAR